MAAVFIAHHQCCYLKVNSVRKVSGSTRGHGGLGALDNLGFTDINSSPSPSRDVSEPSFPDLRRRKISRMETQAKEEDLRKK